MWISIHYIWGGGCPVALPQLSWSFLEMLRTYCFWALQLSQPHPRILSPCISINVHVYVLCKRSWEGGLVTPPPSLGWMCHHILKWLVKYLCVWVCPWWCAEIDHFFRWLLGHKTRPNYLIIFIWPKGSWLVAIGSSNKRQIQENKSKNPNNQN